MAHIKKKKLTSHFSNYLMGTIHLASHGEKYSYRSFDAEDL